LALKLNYNISCENELIGYIITFYSLSTRCSTFSNDVSLHHAALIWRIIFNQYDNIKSES